jgi:hypothetical protein
MNPGARPASRAFFFWAAVLSLILGHGLIRFASDALATVRSPWSRDYGEGCTLALASLLVERGDYFPALVDYPFLVANYPPVFVSLVALGQVLFGPTLFVPRMLALLATLALMGSLFKALRTLPLPLGPAAALTLVFAMPWFVTTWAALARVDTLAIALSLAGLVVVLRSEPGRAPWPALACFWLAFFTKQNAVAAPAAVLLELALARDRRFGRALAAYALPLAALFGLLVLVTHGRAFTHLVVYTAAASYEWDRMAGSYLQLGAMLGPLLALVAAAFASGAVSRADRTGRLLLLYLGLSLAGFATIAKDGAAQNYFIEPWLAGLLAAGWALRGLMRHAAVQRLWPVPLVLAAAVANYAFPALDRLPQALRRPENADEFPVLTRLVHEARGPVLSENLTLPVLDGRPALLDPFGVRLIAEHHFFDPARLVRDCEAGRFALVVVEHRLWDVPGLGACLERRYEPIAALGAYEALGPRRTEAREVR